MSQYGQAQPQYAVQAPPAGSAYNTAPPPVGYPMKDGTGAYGSGSGQDAPPAGPTQSRGDGFWKGCCAALCCCCMLDACF